MTLPEPGTGVNLHAHTFFSYNAYGYSPSKYAWLARKAGLAVAGVVDFDVLDGLEEFLEAGRLIGLKTCVSLESGLCPRVRRPGHQFAGRTGHLLSHGGGLYPCGAAPIPGADARPQPKRTRDVLARVKAYMHPLELDYEKDVLP